MLDSPGIPHGLLDLMVSLIDIMLIIVFYWYCIWIYLDGSSWYLMIWTLIFGWVFFIYDVYIYIYILQSTIYTRPDHHQHVSCRCKRRVCEGNASTLKLETSPVVRRCRCRFPLYAQVRALVVGEGDWKTGGKAGGNSGSWWFWKMGILSKFNKRNLKRMVSKFGVISWGFLLGPCHFQVRFVMFFGGVLLRLEFFIGSMVVYTLGMVGRNRCLTP